MTDHPDKQGEEDVFDKKRYPPVNVRINIHGGFQVDPEEIFQHPRVLKQMAQMDKIAGESKKDEADS